MIKETKQFKITPSTTATGYSYTLVSDDASIIINKSLDSFSDNLERTIDFTFTLLSEASFAANYTLTVIENGTNCVKIYNFTISNFCELMTVSIANTPTATNPFVYTATVAGGNSPYILDWEFDKELFNPRVVSNSNPLTLSPLSTVTLPDTTTIRLRVTDKKGCTKTAEYLHAISSPNVTNQYITATCVDSYFDSILKEQIKWKATVTLIGTPTAGASINWSTLEITSPHDNIILASSVDGVSIYVKDNFRTADLVLKSTYDITYRVKDTTGVYSNVGVISLLIPICRTANTTISLPARGRTQIVQLETAEVTNLAEKTFELEVFTDNDEEIDWTTFTFIPGTGQTLPKPDLLTGVNGGALKLPGCKIVTYTVNAGPYENAELLQYKVDTKNGQTSNIGRVYIDFQPSTAPVATNDSDTTVANLPTVIDILANDTGDINKGSVVITENPTQTGAVVTVNVDGTVTFYSPDADAHTFKYQVYNTDDIISNEATVSVQVNNSGIANNINQCKEVGVDLFDFLTAPYSSGGTWSQDGGNPSALVITTPTNVDFSSATAGTYSFTYSVGSSPDDVATTVSIVVPAETIVISTISVGTVNPFTGGAAKGIVSFTTAGIRDVNSLYIEVVGPTTTVNYNDITFNKGAAGGTIEYHDGAGSYDITVYGTTFCGNAIDSGATTKVV